jgi:hypothetical protein
MEDNSLNSKEWQLLLVLQELRHNLSDEEKNQKLIKWIEEKIKDLEKRSGW